MRALSIAGLAALFFLASCGSNTTEATDKPSDMGQSVYTQQCSRCHGSNGKLGMGGAKDLSITQLSPDEMQQIIRNGAKGGMMPAYGEVLSNEEIIAVSTYIEKSIKN